MKTWTFALLGVIFMGLPAAAGTLEMVLNLPSGNVAAGQPLPLTVYLTNPGSQSAAVELPESLVVRLQPQEESLPVMVTARSERGAFRVEIAPGHFERVVYTLILPPELDGVFVLKIKALPVQPVMLAVSPVVESEPEPKAPADRHQARQDTLAANFFGHEPVYFLVGPDPTHAKFQISFKYRLLNPQGSLARRWQRFENIYFGYTQTSFWDWESDSAPFYDSSYKPELFYYRPDVPQAALPWISTFSFQSGVMHESNGKDGTDSRSLNIVYLKPGALVKTGPDSHFTIAPRLWTYIGDLDDNPDIDRYRGYFDIDMAWEQRDSWKLAANLRKGTGAGKGSTQLDATYPLGEILKGNLDVYLQLQYYTGYAETLRSYNERYDFFRIGFALFR
jgi:outer membrane phospholipase A